MDGASRRKVTSLVVWGFTNTTLESYTEDMNSAALRAFETATASDSRKGGETTVALRDGRVLDVAKYAIDDAGRMVVLTKAGRIEQLFNSDLAA
jgi:hypothetical protein